MVSNQSMSSPPPEAALREIVVFIDGHTKAGGTLEFAGELAEVPAEARVAIVGGGYAGLAAALELAKHGIDAVVLEMGALGVGASTRNGGSVRPKCSR